LDGEQTIILGSDQGVVSFVGDVMHFQGRKTSFSLGNTRIDAKLPGSGPDGSYTVSEVGLALAVKRRYAVTWQSGSLKGGIDMWLFDESANHSDQLLTRFRTEYFEWLYASPPSTRENTYPPIGPDPVRVREQEQRIPFYYAMIIFWGLVAVAGLGGFFLTSQSIFTWIAGVSGAMMLFSTEALRHQNLIIAAIKRASLIEEGYREGHGSRFTGHEGENRVLGAEGFEGLGKVVELRD
jgi:hypothetical protein